MSRSLLAFALVLTAAATATAQNRVDLRVNVHAQVEVDEYGPYRVEPSPAARLRLDEALLRNPLGGPVTMLVLGAGAAVGASYLASRCYQDIFDECARDTGANFGFGLLAATGIGVSIAGAVALALRVPRRRRARARYRAETAGWSWRGTELRARF